MYDNGEGTEANFFKARRWYQEAVDNGYSGACEKLIALKDKAIAFVRNSR